MFKASLVTMKGVGDLMSYQLPKKELYIHTQQEKTRKTISTYYLCRNMAKSLPKQLLYRKCRDSLEDITNMLHAIIMKSTNYYIPDTQFLSCFLPFRSRLNHERVS